MDERLKQEFDKKENLWIRRNCIFLFVLTYDKTGMGYVGYRYVNKFDLYGRRYKVDYGSEGYMIIFLDCFHNPSLYEGSQLSKENRLTYFRKKTKIRRKQRKGE